MATLAHVSRANKQTCLSSCDLSTAADRGGLSPSALRKHGTSIVRITSHNPANRTVPRCTVPYGTVVKVQHKCVAGTLARSCPAPITHAVPTLNYKLIMHPVLRFTTTSVSTRPDKAGHIGFLLTCQVKTNGVRLFRAFAPSVAE